MRVFLKQNRYLAHVGLMFAACLCTGGLAIYFGKDLSWDLANYHFTNPYLWLYGKQIHWPVSYIHQFLNPLLDVPTYFLMTHLSSWWVTFCWGAWHGINFYLLYVLARLFIPVTYPFKLMLALFLAALGLYGPSVLPGIGSFQNDNSIAIFILLSLLIQVRYWQGKLLHGFAYCSAFFILGMAAGLKLTAIIFVLANMLAVLGLAVPFNLRVKLFVYAGISIFLGLASTAAFWMWQLWQHYHNPLFPFFNHIFHSPYFNDFNWRDERFLPKTIAETLAYPFYFSFNGARIADNGFQDIRYLLVYILFIAVGLKWFYQKFIEKKSIAIANDKRFLYLYFILAYVIWQWYFANARYAVALEMLSPLVIFLLILEVWQSDKWRLVSMSMAFYSLIFFMQPIPMIRARWYAGSYFNIILPPQIQQQKALVFVSYSAYALARDPRPQAYLLPFFPKSFSFQGVPFLQGHYVADKATTNIIKSTLAETNAIIYLLTPAANVKAFHQWAVKFALKPSGKCAAIYSDRERISNEAVLLCPYKKNNA